MMYIDEQTEKDNLLLSRDPSTITDEKLLARYWYLRQMIEDNDEDED